MVRMTATEAARSFSDVLNRVAAGEEIEITRGGSPVAIVSPPKGRFLSGAMWRSLLESLPPVDDDFAREVIAARRELGELESSWPS